jgi:hypothetical protein
MAVSCGKDYAVKRRTIQGNSSAARHSFIVRIWREEGSVGWRGWVQHTRSGESTVVQDLDELLAFVEHRTGELGSNVRNRLK